MPNTARIEQADDQVDVEEGVFVALDACMNCLISITPHAACRTPHRTAPHRTATASPDERPLVPGAPPPSSLPIVLRAFLPANTQNETTTPTKIHQTAPASIAQPAPTARAGPSEACDTRLPAVIALRRRAGSPSALVSRPPSLHAYGLGPQVFSRVSELLKSNPHITADKRFESGRLGPDALRNFYLHILKEEIKSERGLADGEVANGETKSSRKRKAPSPSLPTVQESVQHQHLIPNLVNKLYARYRSTITDQIRQDEERYERLQRELQGIERGEWDDQTKEKTNGKSVSRSPSLPRDSPLPPQQPSPSKAGPLPQPADTTHVVAPPALAPVPEGPPRQQPPAEPRLLATQNGQPTPEPIVKPAASPSPRKKKTPAEQRGASSIPQPSVGSIKGHPPPTPPLRLQPQQSAPAAPNGSPPASRSPHPQAQPQVQSQNVPAPGTPHSPQPQAGGHPGPNQPQPIPNFGGNGVPQHAGPPPQFSPTHQRFPGGHQVGPHTPNMQTPQQQRNYPPYAGQPPYPPQYQIGQPPPQGGVMLPPFQVSPQDPARAQQPVHPQYPQVSTPVSRPPSAKSTPQSTNFGRQDVPPMHPLVTQARQSFSTPSGMRTPHSALSTPRSAKSLWKSSVRTFATPDAPRPEPEPIDDYQPSQSQEQNAAKAKAHRKPRPKAKAKEKAPEPQPEPEAPAEEAVPEMETRQGRSRRKGPTKRARPGSIASSQAGTSVRERSRSHSILSHTETVAADNESQAGSRIKSERGTSIDANEEDLASTPQMTTRRRGNLQASQSNKRKRNAREASPEEQEEHSGLPGIPQTVIALRHFSRMCTPLMNDIGSHKHASTFTTAVKAKDAEGYYEIIKRPTDLKSIQKAIAAGAKQVTAAASGDTPAGSPGGGGGVVELPATADNVPPKAIVNSSQLEKELMRMFVNAVMFNAGEEGVVEDARAMFETVQRSVSSWRSVERSSGRLEVEETPPVVEEDLPAAPKRRKL
ncbi:hypothetical protein K458DRAFT_397441 [Lentithecium fluviatile CBS 122367]|uniref:Bromo domain-containing protein n=1 Tax=Lentithecium fluviatile CBS 122367 TaxID=1168545 RepID=A0A6G1IDH5_9PLEO|nr:hypothetical protein K458DRAFT_397441 [Lentithecium fluviatile CBS 122367]